MISDEPPYGRGPSYDLEPPELEECRRVGRKIREGLEQEEGPDLSAGEWRVVLGAVSEAMRTPLLEARLDEQHWREALALKAIVEGKGRDRFRDAARAMAWIAGDDRRRTYPPGFALAWQFVLLTTERGQVTLGDRVACVTGLDALFETADHCPLDPEAAVAFLAGLHGAASSEACLKELWRQKKAIDCINSSGDAVPRDLPDLRGLPQARSC